MVIYFTVLVGATFLAYFAEHTRYRNKHENGINGVLFIALIAYLVFFAGLRYVNVYQSDEWNYRVQLLGYIGQSLELDFTSEWMFDVINWVVANTIGDAQALLFVCSLVTNVSFVLFLRKYAQSFWFAIFLYVGLGSYFTEWNITRQYLAMAIAIWAIPKASEEKPLAYVLIVLLASTIHQSSLLLLPAYFLLRSKTFDAKALVVLFIAVVILANLGSVLGNLVDEDSHYSGYANSIINGTGYGVNPLRLIFWLTVFAFLFWKHRDLIKLGQPVMFFQALLIVVCIYLFSFVNVFINRFAAYFSMTEYCLYSAVPELVKPKYKNFATACMMLAVVVIGGVGMIGFSPYENVAINTVVNFFAQ